MINFIKILIIFICLLSINMLNNSSYADDSNILVYPRTAMHYAPNSNFSDSNVYTPASVGFNLADVSNVDQLAFLPNKIKGLVFLGLCNGADSNFINTLQPFIGNNKVFGFYLMDDPDPTGQFGGTFCPAANLKAESDWIHSNIPGTEVFLALMNLGTPLQPNYMNSYNSANTDIDLFGLDAYPCRPELNGCNYNVIPAAVLAAQENGIFLSQIIPIYQAFGGGGYSSWTKPTPQQEKDLLAVWATVVPAAVFDYAYSWGSQLGDDALINSPGLRKVFKHKNKRDR